MDSVQKRDRDRKRRMQAEEDEIRRRQKVAERQQRARASGGGPPPVPIQRPVSAGPARALSLPALPGTSAGAPVSLPKPQAAVVPKPPTTGPGGTPSSTPS